MTNSQRTPLSGREITALMQIRLQAKLDPQHRSTIARLLHLGLIEERPAGFFVTAAGNERCAAEAKGRGLAQPPAPTVGTSRLFR